MTWVTPENPNSDGHRDTAGSRTAQGRGLGAWQRAARRGCGRERRGRGSTGRPGLERKLQAECRRSPGLLKGGGLEPGGGGSSKPRMGKGNPPMSSGAVSSGEAEERGSRRTQGSSAWTPTQLCFCVTRMNVFSLQSKLRDSANFLENLRGPTERILPGQKSHLPLVMSPGLLASNSRRPTKRLVSLPWVPAALPSRTVPVGALKRAPPAPEAWPCSLQGNAERSEVSGLPGPPTQENFRGRSEGAARRAGPQGDRAAWRCRPGPPPLICPPTRLP